MQQTTNPRWSKYLYIFVKQLAQYPLNHSHSLALGLGPWLAMYAQVSHAAAIRSMRDGARGCLCRGTPLAIYDCSFRRPPESGFSAVPTSFVVRLPHGNIQQYRRFTINPGLARSSHASPRHVMSGKVRRDHVSRDLGLCLSVTVSRSVLAPVILCMHKSRMRLR